MENYKQKENWMKRCELPGYFNFKTFDWEIVNELAEIGDVNLLRIISVPQQIVKPLETSAAQYRLNLLRRSSQWLRKKDTPVKETVAFLLWKPCNKSLQSSTRPTPQAFEQSKRRPSVPFCSHRYLQRGRKRWPLGRMCCRRIVPSCALQLNQMLTCRNAGRPPCGRQAILPNHCCNAFHRGIATM